MRRALFNSRQAPAVINALHTDKKMILRRRHPVTRFASRKLVLGMVKCYSNASTNAIFLPLRLLERLSQTWDQILPLSCLGEVVRFQLFNFKFLHQQT